MRALGLAFIVLMAGCIGASDNEGEDAGSTEPDADSELSSRELSVDLTECQLLEILAPGDADELASFVPDPFTVPDNPLVALGNLLCGPGNQVSERAFWAIQVTPPDELRSPREGDRFNYFWEPDHFNRDGTVLADAFGQVGAPTQTVNTTSQGTPLGPSFTAGNGSFEWTWSGTGPALDGTWETFSSVALVPFREYAMADGGFAYLDATFGGDEGQRTVAAGVLETSGDSAATSYFGASSTQVAVYETGEDYAEAVVGFVPWP